MVAGASRGLGFAVAKALSREGARISISSRSPEAASAAAEKIRAETGGEVFSRAANVLSAEALAVWHQETLDRFGSVDLLYTNTLALARNSKDAAEYGDSLRFLEEAASLRPQDSEPHRLMAEIYTLTNRPAQAAVEKRNKSFSRSSRRNS